MTVSSRDLGKQDYPCDIYMLQDDKVCVYKVQIYR